METSAATEPSAIADAPPPDAPSPEARPPAPPTRYHRFEFTGTAGEYFRIWIVNLFLSVVTLGIYSAWAKVRKKRYFYEHTFVAGESFEYHGRPLAILKGRLLAVVVTLVIYGASHVAPWFLWIAIPLAILGLPWLLVRSYAFNAHNSAWRNIRLRFDGGYARCLGVLALYGLVTILTLGLGYAYLKTRLTEFIVRHHAYGATRFEVPNLKKAFFGVYGKLIGLSLVGFTIYGALFATIFSAIEVTPDSPLLVVSQLFSYLLYLALFAYVRSRIVNATFNQATLGPIRFESSLGARGLFKLYVTNIAAIVVTLGLATPWAVVRTLRYRADRLVMYESAGLDGLPAAAGDGPGASGEEIAEMMDIDFSI